MQSICLEHICHCDLKPNLPNPCLGGPEKVRQELAKPPDPIPDPYKDKIAEFHSSVAALFTKRQVRYYIQQQLAEDGYTTIEDVADRWEDADQ